MNNSEKLTEILKIVTDIPELRNGYPDKEAQERDEALTQIVEIIESNE